MQLTIALISFAIVFLLLVAVSHYLTKSRQAIRERMARYVHQAAPVTAPVAAVNLTQELAGWRAFIRQASKYFEWSKWSRSVEHKLIQAGLPLKGAEFAAICFGTAMFGALLLHALTGGASSGGMLGSVLPSLAGAMLGYLLPQIFLSLKIKQRAKAFNTQLGDALILTANSLRTGYSFLQAIELVAKEMRPPLSVEFIRMLKEMNLGVTTEEAMNNLAKRIDSDDLDLVVTAVLIQRQVGGNLAEVLDNIANTIRERVRLKGEIKTLTAQGRMSGIIIGLLPFVLAIALYAMNPTYMGILFIHPLGQFMLALSAMGMVVGLMWVKQIVNIEI